MKYDKKNKPKSHTGLPPHHWVKFCPLCGGINLKWFWDSEEWYDKQKDPHPNQEFCEDCKKWVTPSRRRVFID